MNDLQTKETLTPLQGRLLEMFKWFHEFCKDNGIRYYALGGTMLGAVRHKGFIPWDDDIDVGVPRKDYEKIRRISATLPDGRYCFEFPDTQSEVFATPYAKLYDTGTLLIENYYKPYKRGIFIDIFPLDGTGNNYKESCKYFKQLKAGYNLFMTKVAAINKKRAPIKNAAIVFARLIPDSLLSARSLRLKLDKKAALKDFDKMLYGGNLFGNWGIKEIMKTSIMGKPKEYEFNGITIYGAENYDEYLSLLYGDWRQLPPVEKRVSHHDFIELDINKSYLS